MSISTLVAACVAATLQAETYYQYVARSVAYDSDLTDALSSSNEPLITMESLQPLASANAAFLDGVIAPHNLSLPSTSAIISVPLLVQITRDWSAGGQVVRDLTYRPLLQSLIPFLLDIPSPRILVPGSGTGRLAFMLAERLEGAQITALDPDEHAQIVANHFLTAGEGDDDDDANAPPPPPAAALPSKVYPSLHISNNWAQQQHRMAGVEVPDVPIEALRKAGKSANITFAVGELDDNVEQWIQPEAFDALATCFVLDVLDELPRTLKALHGLLRPTRGLWVNVGPMEFPRSPTITGAAQRPEELQRAVALTASQFLHLVRQAGFVILEERLIDGCEYDALPHQLKRTVRTCLFFVARPAEEAAAEAPPPDASRGGKRRKGRSKEEL